MERGYLLGFDCGTGESKGTLCTLDGKLVARASRPHSLRSPKPGWAEHDPIKDWWVDFVEVVGELLTQSGILAEEIAAVGISTVMAGITPIDRDGNPLRNAILYGIDSRCLPEANCLNHEIGLERIKEWAGDPLDNEMFGPKILWIREHEPEVYKRTYKFTIASGFLTFRLTGRCCVDKYSAMAAQPMLDRKRMAWDDEMCRLVCPKEMLPDIVDTTEIVGTVTKRAAAETGLAEGTPVICGTTDAGAEAVSVGVVAPEDMMLMYGSTSFFLYVNGMRKEHMGMWSADYTIKGLSCCTGGMATTGSLTKWIRDTMARELVERERAGGENAYQALFAEAENVPLGSRGLMILPYFMGERMPIKDPYAKGMIFGLNLNHSRGDLVHAAFEGIGFGICQNLDILRRNGARMDRITAVGGGTKAPQYLQIVSDICGIRQAVPEVNVGASYGDALLAGIGVGAISGPEQIKRIVQMKYIVEPNPERTKAYAPYKERFRELYIRNKDLMSQHLAE